LVEAVPLIVAFLLLLFAAPAFSEVIDSHNGGNWSWLRHYQAFITAVPAVVAGDGTEISPAKPAPTLNQHLEYCKRERQSALNSLEDIWRLQAIENQLRIARDDYALMAGEAYIRHRFFRRCAFDVEREIEQQATKTER
jgi:hypothetical protein